MSSPSDKKAPDKSVLADFSVTQIVVAGLAAATSFALSTQIGIAGSAIGAVIGAVASATASQVYRKIIETSAEKLRGMGDSGDDAPEGQAAPASASGATPAEETTLWEPESLSGRVSFDGVAASGTPIAPREVRYAARAREQARIRRRVAAVGAAVGVAAVLAFALVAYVATQGAGIGQTAQERPVVEDGSASSSTADASPAAGGSPAHDEGSASSAAGEGATSDGTSAPSASSDATSTDTTGSNATSTDSDSSTGDGAASSSDTTGSSGTEEGSVSPSDTATDAASTTS